MGRPRRAKKESTRRIVARVTDVELADATRAAALLGISVSEFVRESVKAHVLAHTAVDARMRVAESVRK